jgi:hypothetical protein
MATRKQSIRCLHASVTPSVAIRVVMRKNVSRAGKLWFSTKWAYLAGQYIVLRTRTSSVPLSVSANGPRSSSSGPVAKAWVARATLGTRTTAPAKR